MVLLKVVGCNPPQEEKRGHSPLSEVAVERVTQQNCCDCSAAETQVFVDGRVLEAHNLLCKSPLYNTEL